MMKKVVLLLVLSLAVAANAALVITVNGQVWENSILTITPSTWVVLGIMDDGGTVPGSLSLGMVEGPGSFDASGMVTSQGVTAAMTDNALLAENLGLQNPFISIEIGSTQVGMVANGIDFHCDGPGDVRFAIVDDNGNVLDDQVIHQIPEPLTIALLGLGGLFLRRRTA